VGLPPSPSGELKGASQHSANSPPWEGLGEAPDTPVQKGIESFIDWYKSYFAIKL